MVAFPYPSLPFLADRAPIMVLIVTRLAPDLVHSLPPGAPPIPNFEAHVIVDRLLAKSGSARASTPCGHLPGVSPGVFDHATPIAGGRVERRLDRTRAGVEGEAIRRIGART